MSTEISFSPWVNWASRNSLPGRDKPTVYLIARFEQNPSPGPADPCEKSIVYIGGSSRGRLQARWRSFDGAAFEDKGRHRGGKRYNEQFGGDSSVVYVATLPGDGLITAFLELGTCPLLDISISNSGSSAKVDITDVILFLDEIEDLLVRYMERRLILLYSLAQGHRPLCNAD